MPAMVSANSVGFFMPLLRSWMLAEMVSTEVSMKRAAYCQL